MSDITIPPSALKAVKELLYPFLHTESDDIAYDIARAACLAMLRHWPGLGTVATEDHAGTWRQIILPIQQESTNEQE